MIGNNTSVNNINHLHHEMDNTFSMMHSNSMGMPQMNQSNFSMPQQMGQMGQMNMNQLGGMGMGHFNPNMNMNQQMMMLNNPGFMVQMNQQYGFANMDGDDQQMN